MNNASHRIRALAASALCAWLGSRQTALAQTWTGAASEDNWSAASNWDPAVPTNDGLADLVFDGARRPNPVVDVPWRVEAILFASSASGFVVSGLALGIGQGGVFNRSSELQTLNNVVALRTSQTWTAGSGALWFGGPVSVEGHALTVGGSESVSLAGSVSGSGAIIHQGPGLLRLSGPNSFSGGLLLNGGVLTLGSDTALGSGTFYPATGSVGAEGGARTLSNELAGIAGATPTFDSPFDLSFGGDVLLAGNQRWQVENSGVVTLAGRLVQSGAGTTLTKLGAGTLAFAGTTANTLPGVVSALEGELRLVKVSGSNAIAGDLIIGGSTRPATVLLQAGEQIADTSVVRVDKLGLLDLNGFAETVRGLQLNGGGVATGSGVLTVREGIGGLASDKTAQIEGRLTLNGATQTVFVAKGSVEVDLLIQAGIGDGGLIKVGPGTLVLAGENTFNGGLLTGGGVVSLANDRGAGTGPLRLGAGRIQAEGAARTLANTVLVGCWYCRPGDPSDPTFSGATDLTFSGPAVLGGIPVWNVENTGQTIFSGAIGEDEAGRGLIKEGTGLLVFSGPSPNTYSGPTRVREGVLLLSKADGVNAVAGSLDIGGLGRPAVVQLGSSEQIADTNLVLIRSGGLLALGGFVETASLALAGGSVDASIGRLILASDLQTLASDSTATIRGTVDLAGAARMLNVGDYSPEIDLQVDGTIMNGTLYKAGSGRLLLTGDNVFAGGFVLLSGSVGLGTDTALGQGLAHVVSSDATFSAEYGTRTLSNPLNLHANLTLGGTDNLILLGEVSLSGKTTLIVSNRTVVAGPVGESGGSYELVKKGPGTLAILGSNSVSRALEVEAGLVEFRHEWAAGRGILLVDGGGVRLGDIAETVQAGPTQFSSNSFIVARLDAPRTNALLRVNGTLALGGRLDVEAGPRFRPGVYRLVEHAATLASQTMRLGMIPAQFTYRLSTTVKGYVDLVVEGPRLELGCPADVVVNCVGEIPPPDLNLAVVQGACGSVTKSFAGDSYLTNGPVLTVLRTYRATDDCGQVAACVQTLTVNEGNASRPVLSLRLQGQAVVICWEQSCGPPYVADVTSDLTAVRRWTPSEATVSVDGDLRCVTLPLVGNKFLRLRRP